MATGRIGVTPTLRTRWSKAPAGGTTSLSGLDDNSVSLVYDVGYEAVYRNGVLLSRTNDYTATTGNSITLIDATIAGDIIEVFANQLLPLTNAIGNGQYTAKGALLSATAASTPAVLTVGSNDQVLTADSTTATGLKWATPSAGGMTLLSTTTVSSGATLTISGISTSYTNLLITIQDLTCSSGQGDLRFKANGSNGITHAVIYRGVAASAEQTDFVTSANFSYEPIPGTNYNVAFVINIYDYANTSYHKPWTIDGAANIQSSTTVLNIHGRGKIATTSAITSLQFDFRNGQTFTGGVFKVYGVK